MVQSINHTCYSASVPCVPLYYLMHLLSTLPPRPLSFCTPLQCIQRLTVSYGSATHRVFCISELLQQIIEECAGIGVVNRGTVLALAKTCTLMNRPAIKVLWRVLDGLQPLLYLLPSEAVENMESSNYIVCPPPSDR